MADKALELRTQISSDGWLEVRLEEHEIPRPGADEILVRMEAAPVNPSDQLLLFGPADLTTLEETGNGVRARVPPQLLGSVRDRLNQPLRAGNEGAGTVVAAGSAATAERLQGRVVGVFSGGTYSQYCCVKEHQCLPLHEGTSAIQGASCFVNPMTALCMTETMRMEGYSGLVHTAAASNLGLMLNRVCMQDGIPLVNIVRRDEQVSLLKGMGAEHVTNSGSDNFRNELESAIAATDAFLAFDAIGGGTLVDTILSAMEAVASRDLEEYNRYGTERHKQVYIYGKLDKEPARLSRNYGFAWGVAGWLLPIFLRRLSAQRLHRLQERIAAEITTTFESRYHKQVGLREFLQPAVLAACASKATGEKYLLLPRDG